MDEGFIKAGLGDEVYKQIFWKSLDDHYDNVYLCYNEFLREKLEELKTGNMPIEVYNNFLEKGVLKILEEMKQKDDNSRLLMKIKRENPELLE